MPAHMAASRKCRQTIRVYRLENKAELYRILPTAH